MLGDPSPSLSSSENILLLNQYELYTTFLAAHLTSELCDEQLEKAVTLLNHELHGGLDHGMCGLDFDY